MKKIKKIFLILLAASALPGCSADDEVTVDKSLKIARTTEIRTESVGENITLSGNIVPVEQVQLSFKLAGVIESVNVQEGDKVKKGQKIASLKTTDYNIQKKAAIAAKSAADSQMEQARAGIDGAKAQAEAAQAQIEQTQAGIDGAKAQAEAAQAQIEQAQAGIDAAKAQAEQVQIQIDKTIPEKISQAKSQLDLTQSNYDSIYNMYKSGIATKNSFDEISAKLSVAKSTYQEALDSLPIAEKKLSEAQAQIQSYESALKAAQASHSAAQAQVDAAISQTNTVKSSSKAAQAQINAAVSQTNAAKSSSNAAQAQVDAAQSSINDTTISSTIDGVILKKVLNAGETAAAGHPVVIIGSTDKMWVQVGVPDQYIGIIKKGQKADIHIYGTDKTVKGTIDEVGAIADTSTRTFTVKILVDNNTGQFRAGMICKADINISDGLGFLVPIESVINLPTGDTVYIVENGKAINKSVSTGSIRGDKIEILNGLKEGDHIVTDGQNVLNNGDDVYEDLRDSDGNAVITGGAEQ